MSLPIPQYNVHYLSLILITILQVQIDILSTVSNLQQVPPDELGIGQERTGTSSRFVPV